MADTNFTRFPGGELITKGLADLRNGVSSDEALLVHIASPRLKSLGIDIPVLPEAKRPVEHQLFESLERADEAGAYGLYNSLIARAVSFANAYSLSRKV